MTTINDILSACRVFDSRNGFLRSDQREVQQDHATIDRMIREYVRDNPPVEPPKEGTNEQA